MTDTPLTDDYVAEILKKDASRKDQNRYLTNSLGGLLSSTRGPRSNASKPNTRFLRNLVRDADSHNAALRRKEEEESRARLRGLRRGEEKDERKEDRQGESRRRREGLSPRERHHKRDRSRDREIREKRDRSRSRERSRSRSPRRERHRSHGHRERKRPRSRSPDRNHTSRSKHSRRHRRHRDQDSDDDSHRDTKPPQRKAAQSTKPTIQRSPSASSDSDPLTTLLGPKPSPTVVPRGRGAQNLQNSTSNIDTRFSASYDPKTDISPTNSENDGWDAALEAFRDRARLKQRNGERLLAAGFTEEEVARSQAGGGGEGDIASVKWRKRGEGREWDRGKVLEGEFVDLRPSWGGGEGEVEGDVT